VDCNAQLRGEPTQLEDLPLRRAGHVLHATADADRVVEDRPPREDQLS
jgi:hypothetical protein